MIVYVDLAIRQDKNDYAGRTSFCMIWYERLPANKTLLPMGHRKKKTSQPPWYRETNSINDYGGNETFHAKNHDAFADVFCLVGTLYSRKNIARTHETEAVGTNNNWNENKVQRTIKK